MRIVKLLVIAVLIAVGCAADAKFTPYSSTSVSRPRLRCAVEAYRGDIDALRRGGADIVGFIESSGNEYASSQWVKETAAAAAAQHGGTHFIVGATSVDVARYVANTLASSEASCNSERCRANASSTTTAYAIEKHKVSVLVLRVPWNNIWRNLPREMWPVEGLHYAVGGCH